MEHHTFWSKKSCQVMNFRELEINHRIEKKKYMLSIFQIHF